MKTTLVILALAEMLGGAHQMKIDPAKMGATQATLRMEAPALVGYKTIPLFSVKVVHVALSTFAGCAVDARTAPKLTELGKATLTPKESTQSATIPGDMDLAIFADSTESGGGNSVSCGWALRFHSESGGQYLLRFTPHRPWHRIDCNMTLVESRDGQDVPVPSAHDAVLDDKGIWKGSELNICKE